MTHEEQQFHDGWIGKDPEMRDRIDASIHPEQRRRYVPLAVTQTPEYLRVAGLVCETQHSIDKWSDTLVLLAQAKERLVGATEPDALPKLDDVQQELLRAAGKALGPFIGKASGMKRMLQAGVDRLRGEMRALELAARPTVPDSERFSGIGVEEFEKQGREIQAMKGQAT